MTVDCFKSSQHFICAEVLERLRWGEFWKLSFPLARVCSVAISLADSCLVNSAGLQPEFTDSMLSNTPIGEA